MLKKILVAILIALPCTLAAQTVKIGTVDIEAIVKDDPATAEAQKQIEEAQKKYSNDLQKLQEEAQKAFDEYNKIKSDPQTPAAVLTRHEESLANMQQRMQQTAQSYDQDLQNQYNQLMAPIIDKVQKAAQAIAQEKGLTIVVPAGLLIYQGADVLDINPLVKTKLGIK